MQEGHRLVKAPVCLWLCIASLMAPCGRFLREPRGVPRQIDGYEAARQVGVKCWPKL